MVFYVDLEKFFFLINDDEYVFVLEIVFKMKFFVCVWYYIGIVMFVDLLYLLDNNVVFCCVFLIDNL